MPTNIRYRRRRGPKTISLKRRSTPSLPNLPRSRNGKLTFEALKAQPALAARIEKNRRTQLIAKKGRKDRSLLSNKEKASLVIDNWEKRTPKDPKKRLDLIIGEVISQRMDVLAWPDDSVHCARVSTEIAAGIIANELSRNVHWKHILHNREEDSADLVAQRYRNHRRRKLEWAKIDYYQHRPPYSELVEAHIALGKSAPEACREIAKREAALESGLRRDRPKKRAQWIEVRSKQIAQELEKVCAHLYG